MIKDMLRRYVFLIPFGLSFYILDYFLRLYNIDINFGSIVSLAPSFFTLSWVCFFAAITILIGKKVGKYFYVCLISFFAIMLLVNYTYFNVFNTFFSFKSIVLAEEGMNYFYVVFYYLKGPILITLVSCVVLVFIFLRFFPSDKKKSDLIIFSILICSGFICHGCGRFFLGEPVDKLAWDAWNYKRNIYDGYSETRKSLQVSGLYEYVLRDIMLSTIKNNKINPEDIEYLNNYFMDNEKETDDEKLTLSSTVFENNYMNLYKGKNLVFVLMESIDDWLVSEEVMPTLFKLMNEGINFTNHYSPIYGGGATFNSEFTTNTGYMTPFNEGNAAYNYGNNSFPYSLPNLFIRSNYSDVNEFHLNYGTFYNRRQMAQAFGYHNYYGSYDMKIPSEVAIKDDHFIKNKKIRELLLPNGNFMSYVVTYSAHMPYSSNAMECKVALKGNDKINGNEELSCIRSQAKNTDDFFKLLLDKLDKKGIIDDTIIIGVTDHYAYAFNDKNMLYQFKGTDDENLIHKTPFFIWSSDKPSIEVDAVNSNLDVVPTIAYLFGLDHNPKHYLGRNILSSNYDGIVFFNDYSWYDGNIYYKNNQVIIGDNVEKNYIISRNKQVNEILDINKKVLETNYFLTLENE